MRLPVGASRKLLAKVQPSERAGVGLVPGRLANGGVPFVNEPPVFVLSTGYLATVLIQLAQQANVPFV